MNLNITDIRSEGFYISEDKGEKLYEHTNYTSVLFQKAMDVVGSEFVGCDGVCFINGIPYAELVNKHGGIHYKRIEK